MRYQRRLLEEGWLTQSEVARVLGVTPAAIHKAIATGRLRAAHHPRWSSPVIHIEEVKRFAQTRGLQPEEVARRIEQVGQQAGWGPVIIAGLIGFLLGWITARKG